MSYWGFFAVHLCNRSFIIPQFFRGGLLLVTSESLEMSAFNLVNITAWYSFNNLRCCL